MCLRKILIWQGNKTSRIQNKSIKKDCYEKNKQNNKRIKFITTLGIVHILSTMSYCLTQAFISHNSGNIFYFFVLFLFYAFMVNESATTSE